MAVSVAQGDDDMEDRCVCCGAIVPEGTMACPNCLVSHEHIKTNYESILAMSLTELALFMCDNTSVCNACAGVEYCEYGKRASGLINWLKKEVQTDGEE